MDISHRNNAEGGVFELSEGGKRMGYLSYEWADDTVFAIMHTVVEPEFQGRGLAKVLLNAAVEFAREKGYKIRPVCPYVDTMFKRDSSYADVAVKGL